MMDEKKIIKDKVSPILSPVEKRRYTQASKFFTKGMNVYVQDYIIGVKQLAETKQIYKAYTQHYTEAFQEYKSKFDELKKKTANASKSITKKLGVFILGAGAFYLLMKGAAKMFQQSYESFKTFVSDMYDLAKATTGDVLDFTQQWSMRVLNYFPNLKKTLENIIKDVPHLLEGMFNFICNGFHYVFNQSQVFQNILINTALTAYNASFSTSWGWVLGLVFKRARLRQTNLLSSTSFAKFGVDVQHQIQELNTIIETYFTGHHAWKSWYAKVGTQRSSSNSHHQYDIIGRLGSFTSKHIQLNFKNESNGNNRREDEETDRFVNYTSQLISASQKHMEEVAKKEISFYGGMNFLRTGSISLPSENEKFQFRTIRETYGRNEREIMGYHEAHQQVEFSKAWVNLDVNILLKLREYENIYGSLSSRYEVVKNNLQKSDIIFGKRGRERSLVAPKIDGVKMVMLVDLLFSWIMFDYFYKKTQYIVQGIRYHSRFATSYADVIKNQYMSIISFDTTSTTTPFERQYKQYVNHQSDLNQYVDVAVDWMKKTKEEKLEKDKQIQMVGANVMIKWRDLLGIGVLQKKMRNIQNLFRIAYQQKMYGVSYASGQIYNFSDDVSDASLSKNVVTENGKVKELYAGAFEKLKDINGKKDKEVYDNGMDVGQYSSTGVVRNSVAKLDDKSSLAYVAYQIALMYHQVKNYINQLRVQRCQLINSIHKSLNGLIEHKNTYKTKYIDVKGAQ